MKELGNRTITIIAIVITALVTIVSVAGVYMHKQSNEDPLISQLGVEEAVKENNKVIAPYGISLESLKKAVGEDNYLSENFEISDSIYETLYNKDNRDLHGLTRKYSLNGKAKSPEAQKTTSFGAYMNTYGSFENPSSLKLYYRLDNKTNIETAKQSAQGIVTKMFNENIGKFVFSNEEKSYSTKVKSESGEYTLTLSKILQKSDKGNELIIAVDFNETEPSNYDLNTFEHTKGIVPMYQSLSMFQGVKTAELAEKYSTVNSEHSSARLDLLENTISTYSSHKLRSSTVQVTTVYGDDTTTTAVMYMQNTLDNNDKVTKHTLKFDSALQYRKTPGEVLNDAKKALKEAMGITIDITADEIAQGSFERSLKQKVGDIDYDISIEVDTNSDVNGSYGKIRLSGI